MTNAPISTEHPYGPRRYVPGIAIVGAALADRPNAFSAPVVALAQMIAPFSESEPSR